MNLSVEHVLLFALVVCAFYYINRVEGMTEGLDPCNFQFSSEDDLFSQQMQCYSQPGCAFVQKWDGNTCVTKGPVTNGEYCRNVEANWGDLSVEGKGLVCQQIGIANADGNSWKDLDVCAMRLPTEADQHYRCYSCKGGSCIRDFPAWYYGAENVSLALDNGDSTAH